EAYQHGLKLHPEHQASRHNLGLTYVELERYPEAIEQYEELLRRGTSNPTSYENLASVLVQTGNIERARAVADDFVRRQPENAIAFRTLGTTLIVDKRLAAARAALEKSEALDPLDFVVKYDKAAVAMLQDRWSDVSVVADEMARSAGPFPQFLGARFGGQGAPG